MIDPTTRDLEGDGEWGRIIPDALIAIHSIVLPDGKVLSFGTDGTAGNYDARFVYSLYDPMTDELKVLPNTTGTNIFCSNMSIDPNTGNVIIMGGDNHNTGDGGTWSGRADVVVFDYTTETIRNLSDQDPAFELHQARWYGTTVNLANGEILMIGGRDENFNGSTIAEIYNHETGMRQLSGVNIDDFLDGDGTLTGTYYYAHAWQVSDGSVIMIEAGGTSNTGHDVYRIDVEGEGSYQQIGTLPFPTRNLTSSIMYEPDQVLVASTTGQIYKADLSQSVPTWELAFTITDEDGSGDLVARTNGTFTMMPDGRVAMVGGSSSAGLLGDSLANAQKTVFLWDPETGETSFSAEQDLTRMYHSTGLILPTGEIWSAGSGSPGPQENANAQVLTPDYLFDESGNQVDDRPEFISAPSNVESGTSVRLRIDDTSDVSKVTFIKSGAATHARNADARFIELEYRVINSNTIEVDIPPANIAIPGLWMMFIVDNDGTPSLANMTGVDMVPLQNTGNLSNEPTIIYNIDDEQIDGAFALAVSVRFDSLEFSQDGQTVFELGNGIPGDVIRLAQVGNTTDMEFVFVQDGVEYRLVAEDSIVLNEEAVWRVGIDADGVMRLTKDSDVLGELQAVVPADVERSTYLVGESASGESELFGLVRDLKIANYGNFAELDPTNDDSPCSTTGEAVCLCNKLVPDVDDTEGNDAAKVFEDYSILDGDVTELENGARGENDTDLTFSGILAFADADVEDTHTATLRPLGTDYVGTLTLGAPTTTVEAITGSVNWDFVVNDADLDFLEEGQVIVQTYEVDIDDGNGAVTTTQISVTLTGTDDSVPTEADFIVVDNIDPTSGDDNIVLGDNIRLMNGDYFSGGSNYFKVGNYFELRDGRLDFDNSDDFAWMETGLRPRLFGNDIRMDEGGITNTLILGNVAEFSQIKMDGNGANTRNSVTIGNSSKSDDSIILDSSGSSSDWAQIDLNIGNVVEIGGAIDADGYYAERDFDFGYLVTVDGPMYLNGGGSTRNDISIGQGFTLNGVWYGAGGVDDIELGRDWDISGPMYLYGGNDTLKLGTSIVDTSLTYFYAGAGRDTLILDVNADDLASFEATARGVGWQDQGGNQWAANSLDLNWNGMYLFDFEDVQVNVVGGNVAPVIVGNDTVTTGAVTELLYDDDNADDFQHRTNGTIEYDDPNAGDTHSVVITPDGSDYLGEIQYDQPNNAQFGLLPWVFAVDDADLNTLDAGEVRTQTYTVVLSDQDGASVAETITVTLTGAEEYVPPVLSISGGDEVLEGDAGEVGALAFVVSLDKPALNDVTATVTVAGRAVGPDTITIPAGETEVQLAVAFEGNDSFELDETVTVTLSDLNGAQAGTIVASGTILNDDLIPAVISLTGPAEAVEADLGASTNLTYRAELDVATTEDVAATVFVDGAFSQMISISAGQTAVEFDVTLDGDNIQESGETLSVSLTNITGASAGAVTVETAVIDNDTPTISLFSGGDTVEGDGGIITLVQFIATLDKSTNLDVEAQVNIAGNATGPRSVTIPAGATEVSFALQVVGDDLTELDETISVTLSDLVNADAGSLTASAVVFDDDEPAVPDDVLLIDTLQSFGGYQDLGRAEVSEDQTSITLIGNAWKATMESITVTADTVMTFDLNVEDGGEILGIAFETDNGLTATRTFQFAGSQYWAGHQDYRYDEVAGGTQTITVNVGEHFTGSFDRLVFVGDDDRNASTLATFSNVRIHEPEHLPNAPESFVIEAEDYIASGFVVEGRGNSQTNGQVASLLGGGLEGTIAYEFEGVSGLYDIDVFAFDETDGSSPIDVLVNGSVVNTFVLDQLLGSAVTSENNLVSLEIIGVSLEQGDLIEIKGARHVTEFARIDRIEFDYQDQSDLLF